jgi:hypothetical protein
MRFQNPGIGGTSEFTQNLLDFENAFPIIWRKRAPVRLSAMRTVKPGPDVFCVWLFLQPGHRGEVIMTSKREYYGSQEFFALDIPVT